MPVTSLPYFIQNLTGIGGVLKQRAEDFVVHEIPRYQPCGDGEHAMLEIEKTGLTTLELVDHVAKRLKVPRREIGYAGLKDKQAVTRQWLTVRGVSPDMANEVMSDRVKVLYADRHRNKLRLGHLAGNRFVVKVRDVDPMKVVTLTAALKTIAARGLPNYFGPQRFGRRDRNDQIGLAFAAGDLNEVLRLVLGDPDQSIDGDGELQARQAFENDDLAAAFKLWPTRNRDELRILKSLIDHNDPALTLTKAVDGRIKSLWMSALQSRLFNAIVAARIGRIDAIEDGDLAYKHANGAVFDVLTDELAAARTRAEAFEISATGPMIGESMQRPSRDGAELERAALVQAGLPAAMAEYFTSNRPDRSTLWPANDGIPPLALPPGERRPLRVEVDELRTEAGIDEHGPYITVAFALPAGAYATVLLRELMRND